MQNQSKFGWKNVFSQIVKLVLLQSRNKDLVHVQQFEQIKAIYYSSLLS